MANGKRMMSAPVANGVPKARGAEPIWYLKTEQLSKVRPQPVHWVVRSPDGQGLFPAGLSVLVGDPGAGKSTLVRAVVASLTTGRGDFPADPGDVLFLCWEDDESSLVLPHLLACGGDPRRVHLIRGITSDIGAEDNWAPCHLGLVRLFLQEHPGVRLVVVDVLATLTAAGGRDSHNGEDVRGLLDPLHKLGQELGVAVLLLHHQNKRIGERALTRVAGSIQISGTARIVWALGEDPDQPDLRQVAPVKSNLPGRSPGFCFKELQVDRQTVVEHAQSCGIDMPPEIPDEVLRRVEIVGDRAPVSADELARGPSAQGRETSADKAEEWLRAFLGEVGEAADSSIRDKAKKAGVGERALWAAKKALKEAGLARSSKRGGEWWLIATAPEGHKFEDFYDG